MTAIIITITAIIFIVGLTPCIKTGKSDDIVNYDYIER